MRDVSIPAWTVLREPSASSVPPSEDELQSRASPSDMVDEIAPSPPIQQRSPARKKQQSTVGLGGHRVSNGTTAAGSSSAGMQPPSTAPLKPSVPSFSRRPLSGSDGEEALRPKKKKKRRIIDPEKGPAAAGTRVSLNGTLPTDGPASGKPSSTNGINASARFPLLSATQESRRNRRVTLDGGALPGPSTQPQPGTRPEADRRSSAIGLSSSSHNVPGPSANGSQPSRVLKETPLQRAQARRKSRNPADGSVNQSNGKGPVAGPSTQPLPRAPPAPSPHEVIEILDSSDDEPALPLPKAKTPAKPPAPVPPPTQARNFALPRRTKYKAAPVPKYREDDNGVIILTSDEDDSPPAQSVPSGPSKSPPVSKAPAQPPEPPPKPVSEVPNAPVPLVSNAGGDVSTPTSATEVPRHAESKMTVPGVEDVEMAEDNPNHLELLEEPPTTEESSFTNDQPMDDFVESPEPMLPDPQEADAMVEDTLPPADILPETHPPTLPPPASPKPLESSPRSPVETGENSWSPPEEASSRADTPRRATPAQLDTIPTESPPHSPLIENNLAAPSPALSPQRLPSLPPMPSTSPPTRSETATPVSAVLDVPLKDLAISGSSAVEDSGAARPPSMSQPAPMSTSSMQADPPKFLSQPLPRKKKIRIKGGSLHGGPDGFFASVYRVAQKRRANLLSSQASSKTPASTDASQRATASVSPKASRVARRTPSPASPKEQQLEEPVLLEQLPRESDVGEEAAVQLEKLAVASAPQSLEVSEVSMEDESTGAPSAQMLLREKCSRLPALSQDLLFRQSPHKPQRLARLRWCPLPSRPVHHAQ
ncbi:hypothetical protein OH77DRAFT_1204049 [Trametes cingulata]|nr:hypothetical protein OH77DRAFT_1204049 [Trametes cingulata]